MARRDQTGEKKNLQKPFLANRLTAQPPGEETDAIQSVLALAIADKKVKSLIRL